MTTIPSDVLKYVARAFPPSEQKEALSLLESATIHDGSAAGDRLVRCAVMAGGGSLDRLRVQVETLKIDYRDVIVAGEYASVDGELVQIRDLNEPIPGVP